MLQKVGWKRSNKIADLLMRLFSVFSFAFDTYIFQTHCSGRRNNISLLSELESITIQDTILSIQIKVRAFWHGMNIKANAKPVASTMWLIMQCPPCESKAWLSTGCHKQGLKASCILFFRLSSWDEARYSQVLFTLKITCQYHTSETDVKPD